MERPQSTLTPPLAARANPVRWGLAVIGIIAFILGGIGAVTPVMPTTVFLLIGSYCLVRACPWLEQRLLGLPLFRKHAAFIRSTEPMPLRVRLTALGMMWLSISISMGVLAATGRLSWLLAGIAVGLGLIGTVAILLFRRAPRVSDL